MTRIFVRHEPVVKLRWQREEEFAAIRGFDWNLLVFEQFGPAQFDENLEQALYSWRFASPIEADHAEMLYRMGGCVAVVNFIRETRMRAR